MTTFDNLVDWLGEQFDVPQTRVAAVVNERQREMVAEASWAVTETTLTTTVAGQATYPVAGTIVHISRVQVGTDTYNWAGEDEVLQFVTGAPGLFFSQASDATGAPMIRLWPTPTESGLAIMVTETSEPADDTYGSSTPLVVPQRVVRYLRAGCRGTLLREVSERPDLAQGEEQDFQTGVRLLRAYRNSLVGPGVTRARIQGYDFTVT